MQKVTDEFPGIFSVVLFEHEIWLNFITIQTIIRIHNPDLAACERTTVLASYRGDV